MTLSLSPSALSGAVPKIYDEKTGAIAEPNRSLLSKQEVKWDCHDWITFHRSLITLFMKGQAKSRIKYSKEKATQMSNEIFISHWNRASVALTRCGFAGEFYIYFNSVGLSSIFNATHRTANATVEKTGKILDSASNTLVNTVDNTGKIVEGATGTAGNLASAAKYIVPVAVGGVVLLVGTYLYKNYIKGNARVQYGPVKV